MSEDITRDWFAVVGLKYPVEDDHITVLQRCTLSIQSQNISMMVGSDPTMTIHFRSSGKYTHDYRFYDYDLSIPEENKVAIKAKFNDARWAVWKPHFTDLEGKLIHLNNYFDRQLKKFNEDTNNKYVITKEEEDNGIGITHPIETLRYQALSMMQNLFNSMLSQLIKDKVIITRS